MIKVGQFLSSRLDVLPPEITARARGAAGRGGGRAVRRHPRARPRPSSGMPLERAYASFDPVPIAAASLGQAHRARLSPAIAADLGLRGCRGQGAAPGHRAGRRGRPRGAAPGRPLARRGCGWSRRRVDAPALVEEFAATSLEEIDYLHEAGERRALRATTSPTTRASRAPVVVWERTSLRVLTLSDVTAIKITDVAALDAAGIDPAAVAQELARATFQQIFVAGFFHADPHPGNIFVTPGAAEPADAVAPHLRRLRHDGRDLRHAARGPARLHPRRRRPRRPRPGHARSSGSACCCRAPTPRSSSAR